VEYNQTTEYNKECDSGIRWDSFGFDWQISNPVTSERDGNFPLLNDFYSPFE
jgi:dTDP-4-dehydrorhamnose 3,5-epimerase/CDP-3, 6-dideoxy-D-glycero-D-glycero-4-hexulose-5-epimerase